MGRFRELEEFERNFNGMGVAEPELMSTTPNSAGPGSEMAGKSGWQPAIPGSESAPESGSLRRNSALRPLSVGLPRRFAYGPQWRLLAGSSAVGMALLALASMHLIFLRLGVALGSLALVFAFAGALRRLALPRFVELGQNTLSICSGFLQARVTEIPYGEIEQVWDSVTGRMRVLHLRTKDRTFEIARYEGAAHKGLSRLGEVDGEAGKSA